MKQILFICSVLLAGCGAPTEENYYIPKGYTGKIDVIFEEKCGVAVQPENGIYNYRLSKDGILITSNPQIFDAKKKFFYVDDQGNKQELQQFQDDSMPADQAGVYMISIGEKADNSYADKSALIGNAEQVHTFLGDDYTTAHFLQMYGTLRSCRGEK